MQMRDNVMVFIIEDYELVGNNYHGIDPLIMQSRREGQSMYLAVFLVKRIGGCCLSGFTTYSALLFISPTILSTYPSSACGNEYPAL